MSATTVDDGRPQMPRAIAAVVVGAIALASLAALVWPSVRSELGWSGPTEVGVIRRLVDTPDQSPRITGVAPDFEWNAADGTTTRLSALRGKVVVMNFWATWCLPCREEMPALQRVAASSEAVFLVVNLREDGAKARSFLDSLALDRLTPLLDLDGAVARRYAVLALPQTFFIDAAGVVRHIEQGGKLDEAAIRRGIDKSR